MKFIVRLVFRERAFDTSEIYHDTLDLDAKNKWREREFYSTLILMDIDQHHLIYRFR